ncbi:hypothetical protein F2Q68_00019814 [Brassica cretica]|uniref:Uncharacterized protein n=1 Tax=Brassica cretica TaxID=69181 RepID=A0A8S9FXT1_BRACR|nr:hypothetical protein F2Q68_00019814 [Brassica cretica]
MGNRWAVSPPIITAPRPIPACNCPRQFLSLGQLPLTVSRSNICPCQLRKPTMKPFLVTDLITVPNCYANRSSNCSVTALGRFNLTSR